MIGFVVRLLACFTLAVGTVFAIGDIARSLSVEGLRLTTMAEAAATLSLEPYVGTGSGAAGLFAVVAAWPVAPTLAVLALLLLVLARRRPEPARLR